MARLGLAVPPAFVLGYPLFGGGTADGSLGAEAEAVATGLLDELERECGRRLGDPGRPLVVSVRSGAPVSMPGVMATILNVGLTPAVRAGIASRHGEALATALYRRFLENCAAALALSPAGAGAAAAPARGGGGLTLGELESLATAAFGPGFLADPRRQVLRCVGLVYSTRGSSAVRAFSSSLATEVRAETAVTVQRMVFGNLGEGSLSGVVLTRNPITGADELFGEFKRRAQGEDVAMGSEGTEPVSRLPAELAAALEACKRSLVERFRQDLDLEFTVEEGELFLLQARAAKLGPFAQLAADRDFLARGLIDLEAYRGRLDRLESACSCVALPRADFHARRWNPPLAVGVPIYGGVVSGSLVLSEERLREAEARRESVVYFAQSTKPTDFAVMNGASAVVTVYPGRTSHAAITAMSMNKTCIVGCSDAEIDLAGRRVTFGSAGGAVVHEGERVTADGNTGALYRGVAPISESFLPLAGIVAAAREARTAEEAARRATEAIEAGMASLGRESSLRRRALSPARDLAGRRVLVRIDANAETRGGRVLDEARVLQALPALELVLRLGGTPVVCSHLGDPGAERGPRLSREEAYAAYSLRPAAEALDRALGGIVRFHETSVGTSGLLVGKADMAAGAVNVIENLRFATGEKDNDEAFARSLASLADGVYVNDAFNVCHRRHASIAGAPRFAELRLAGPAVARELAALEALLGEPRRPFVAVFGGEELDAQLGVIAALLPRADRLAILAGPASRLRAPVPGGAVVVGEEEAGALAEAIEGAGALLWAGPAPFLRGAAGDDGAAGTAFAGRSLARLGGALKTAAARGAAVSVCGDAERGLTLPDSPNVHISTGPRAFLEYVERLSLPGISALDPA